MDDYERVISMINREFRCPICGSILENYKGEATCIFCGQKEETTLLCPDNHYVCEECRVATQSEIIERTYMNTEFTDPFEIANLIMHHPSFNEHGVEHHELVAPVILAAIRNKGAKISDYKIKLSMKKVKNIPYGACGTMGACGACISAGVAVSIITKASFLSDIERSLVLKATSSALEKISEMGGARCCKQSVYAAIESTKDILTKVLDIKWDYKPIKCQFQDKIRDCKKERCPYYDKMEAT